VAFSPDLERRRVYLPLTCDVTPSVLRFATGVEVIDLPEAERPNLETWGEILSRQDIRKFRETERWLVYDYGYPPGNRTPDPVELLHNTFMALQVAAPMGCDRFIIFTKNLDSEYSDLTVHARNRLHSCGWACLLGWGGITPDQLLNIVNGVLQSIHDKQTRFMNPVRLLEHGLYSSEPYMQTLMWVMGLDGLLMAVNRPLFISRLCRLLGPTTAVFSPLSDCGLIGRTYTVEQVAGEMFDLRSTIAHGKPIPERFWRPLPDITIGTYQAAYRGMPTLRNVLAEGALLLLCQALRTIILNGLMPTFSSAKTWRDYLTS